jgi:hypothetical protein
MLHSERERLYYVYPSWAKLSYSWGNLPGILWNPRRSGYLDQPDKYLDFPLAPPSVDYFDGPEAGGIITLDLPENGRWLGALVLSREATLCRPPGIPPGWQVDLFGAQVSYLEPRGSLEDIIVHQREPKLYLCGATPEHAAAAESRVYWVAVYTQAAKPLKGLDLLGGWAGAFDLELTSLASPPEALRKETAPWFVDPSFSVSWYQVDGGGTGVGWHLAVLLCMALHWRRVAGKRLHALHLVADIEGRLNFRRSWARR